MRVYTIGMALATALSVSGHPTSSTKDQRMPLGYLDIIDVGAVNDYKYTTVFTNAGSDPQVCVCWVETGFWVGKQELDFTIPGNGGKVAMSANEGFEGGCSCGVGQVPTSSMRQFVGTAYMFRFNTFHELGSSLAAASALAAHANDAIIQGLNVCTGGSCSTINPGGGTGYNAYLPGMEGSWGIGVGCYSNLPCHFDVTVAYAG